jgi:hypothetical protein
MPEQFSLMAPIRGHFGVVNSALPLGFLEAARLRVPIGTLEGLNDDEASHPAVPRGVGLPEEALLIHTPIAKSEDSNCLDSQANSEDSSFKHSRHQKFP